MDIVYTVTLRISGLPPEITKDVLLEHFDGYGTISSPVIIKHPVQIELPYAFLWFHDLSQAKRALREENHVILGQKVNVVRVDPTLPPPPPKRALREENHVILGQRVNVVRVDPTYLRLNLIRGKSLSGDCHQPSLWNSSGLSLRMDCDFVLHEACTLMEFPPRIQQHPSHPQHQPDASTAIATLPPHEGAEEDTVQHYALEEHPLSSFLTETTPDVK
ncbi:hypothetical protein CDL15_Pgr003348 [Punica granatum]|uniref:RRM domain-containing protein n=1 Tax=Punica granatum TaxID=22663 RepID=A0A218X2F5_PUNGR|nr:hypothetical protein CDL15_Pgr003348 [Punica granatum]PKI71362.1 hypothetical protein CRG98_008221 [Punica granatum]